MTDIIREKLAQGLQPKVLEVFNDSPMHAGHAGDDGSGESHFRVLIVSPKFEGKSRVERQRMVHGLLEHELANKIHAFSVKAMGVSEYDGV